MGTTEATETDQARNTASATGWLNPDTRTAAPPPTTSEQAKWFRLYVEAIFHNARRSYQASQVRRYLARKGSYRGWPPARGDGGRRSKYGHPLLWMTFMRCLQCNAPSAQPRCCEIYLTSHRPRGSNARRSWISYCHAPHRPAPRAALLSFASCSVPAETFGVCRHLSPILLNNFVS